MLKCFLLALSLSFVCSTFAAPPKTVAIPANARTIQNIASFPHNDLKHSVASHFYKSLLISPLQAYVVTRAPVTGTHTSNAKILKSDAGGAFDKLALAMANDYSVSGSNTTESRARTDYIVSHLLVYKIADGIMALNFSSNDDPRYADYNVFSPAWIGIWKGGKWNTISRHNYKRSDSYPRPDGI